MHLILSEGIAKADRITSRNVISANYISALIGLVLGIYHTDIQNDTDYSSEYLIYNAVKF